MQAFRRVEVGVGDAYPLSVLEGGVGPPVLLIHGFTGTAEAWGQEILTGLAMDHHVIAPDLPGHGLSALPTDPLRYAVDRVVADLVVVVEALTDGPAAWIGYSMGARIALAAAADRPMSALILESGSPGLEAPGARSERRTLDEDRARRLEEDGIERFVADWMGMPLFATQHHLPADVIDRERRRRMAQDPRALAACLRGLGTGAQPSVWPSLPTIGARTLILTGSLDEKFEALGDRMAARLPHATRVSVAGVGHAVHLEAPARWLAAVRAFLGDDPE